ncbi:MAG: D-alanyl-D-alanine carboxypeptidase/D-alanyl-D-alanine-endopeptidase, partial [Rickettsiales bacterium]
MNYSLFTIIITIFFTCVSVDGCAQGLANQIDKAIKEKGDISYGLIVTDLERNKNIIQVHPNRMFSPASVTKIFLSYFALKKLGSDYVFKTTLYAKGKESNQKFEGNLSLKFTGDPSFTEEDLYDLLNYLKENKISYLEGDIVIDDSFFDNKWTSPGGFSWDDQNFGSYASPKHTIVINENRVEASQRARTVGRESAVKINNPQVLKIKNSVKVTKESKSTCPYKSEYMGENEFHVYGCLARSQKSTKLNFALPDTRKMVVSYISHYLQSNNINFSGKFIFSEARGKVVKVHKSTTLRNMLIKVLKDSNNLYSASLFKTIAAKYTGEPGSDENGKKLFDEFLVQNGFRKKYVRIYDGPGESKYNLVSPYEVNKLLNKIYKSKSYFRIFSQSLPRHGVEGTLKYRKQVKEFSRKLIAKTGTMQKSYVSTIAGYYLAKNKYSFVIMMNGHNLSYEDVKGLEDKVLK